MGRKDWGKLTDAQRELASNNYYLVEKHMRFRHLKETDIEDYHGILCESLIKSIMNYKPNDVCSIETYIVNSFNLALKNVYKYYKKTARANYSVISMQSLLNNQETNKYTLEEALGSPDIQFDYNELWQAYDEVVKHYSTRNREIIELYFKHLMTTRETGALTNVSRETVSKITRKFINDLRKELLNI